MNGVREKRSAPPCPDNAPHETHKYELVILGNVDILANVLLRDNADTAWTRTPKIEVSSGRISNSMGDEVNVELLNFPSTMWNFRNYLCLLPPHAVYVIVCDADTDCDLENDAARLLEIVRYYAVGCPVILIWNYPREGSHGTRKFPDKNDLKKYNPCLLETSETSLYRTRDGKTQGGESVRDLRRLILKTLHRHDVQDCQIGLPADEQKLTPGMFAKRVNQLWDNFCPETTLVTHDMIKNQLYYLNRPENSLSESDIWQFYKFTDRETEQTRDILRRLRGCWSSISWDIDHELFLTQISRTSNAIFDLPSNRLHICWKARNRSGEFPVALFHRLISMKQGEIRDVETDCWANGAKFHGHRAAAQAEFHGDTLDVYVWSVTTPGDYRNTGESDYQENLREYLYGFCRIVREYLSKFGIKADEYIGLEVEQQSGKNKDKGKASKRNRLQYDKLLKAPKKKYRVRLPGESKARQKTAQEILLEYYPPKDIVKADRKNQVQLGNDFFRKAVSLLSIIFALLFPVLLCIPIFSFFLAVCAPGGYVSPEEIERQIEIFRNALEIEKALTSYFALLNIVLYAISRLWQGEVEFEFVERLLALVDKSGK